MQNHFQVFTIYDTPQSQTSYTNPLSHPFNQKPETRNRPSLKLWPLWQRGNEANAYFQGAYSRKLSGKPIAESETSE